MAVSIPALLPAGLRAQCRRLDLHFRFTAITSRAAMTTKETWLLTLTDPATGRTGRGECALFRGLGPDDYDDYGTRLQALCHSINAGNSVDLSTLTSSVRFGAETALAEIIHGAPWQIFPSPWSRGKGAITINGLVWMGSEQQMLERLQRKIADGFRCIKVKIGGIDFDAELRLLDAIRRSHSPAELELRLDANGAFTPEEAPAKLRRLADYGVHSIEQPVRAGLHEAMARICAESPIPVALDEELISNGIPLEHKHRLLERLRPAYVILKPSLCGGFAHAAQWIEAAEAHGTGWWLTSALESDIGLNAIAQFAAAHSPAIPQGLGTGCLYHNNITPSPLRLHGAALRYDPAAVS